MVVGPFSSSPDLAIHWLGFDTAKCTKPEDKKKEGHGRERD